MKARERNFTVPETAPYPNLARLQIPLCHDSAVDALPDTTAQAVELKGERLDDADLQYARQSPAKGRGRLQGEES